MEILHFSRHLIRPSFPPTHFAFSVGTPSFCSSFYVIHFTSVKSTRSAFALIYTHCAPLVRLCTHAPLTRSRWARFFGTGAHRSRLTITRRRTLCRITRTSRFCVHSPRTLLRTGSVFCTSSSPGYIHRCFCHFLF